MKIPFLTKEKITQIIKYVVSGLITTGFNLLLFYLFLELSINYIISNVVSYLIATLLFFLINKFYVYRYIGDKEFKTIVKEFSMFIFMRLGTLVLENILLTIFVELISAPILISKIIISILVIMLNYIFSTFFIFKKGKSQEHG